MRDSIQARLNIRAPAWTIQVDNPGLALASELPKLYPRITDFGLDGFAAGGGAPGVVSLGSMVSP